MATCGHERGKPTPTPLEFQLISILSFKKTLAFRIPLLSNTLFITFESVVTSKYMYMYMYG